MKAKRLLSAILAAAMVLGTMSFTALAEGTAVCSISDKQYETLATAIADTTGETKIELFAGTHKMPNNLANKNITFTGSEDAVVEMLTAINASGSTIVFDGITAVFDNDNYEGLQHSEKVVYDNCTIKGTQFLYAPTVEFNRCTFETYNENTEYNVWTYGAKDVKFNDCVFNTNGKAVLVYTEATHKADISFEKCTFNSTGKYTDKAAVELGQSANGTATYNLSFNECTTTGFVTNNSTSPLWGNKNSMESVNGASGDGIGVTIDSAPATPLVTVNDAPYYSLNAAVAAAKDNDKITLLANAKAAKQLNFTGKGNITLDLNGKTLSINDKEAFYWLNNPNSNLTIQNGTIDLENVAADTAVFHSEGEAVTTFSNVKFTGKIGYVNALFQAAGKSKMSFKGGSIQIDSPADKKNYMFSGENSESLFEFDGTNVDLKLNKSEGKGFLNAKIDVKNETKIIISGAEKALDYTEGTIDNSTIKATDSVEYGIRNSGNGNSLVLNNGSKVVITGSKKADIYLKDGSTVNVFDNNSTLTYNTADIDETSKINKPRAFILKVGGQLAETENKAVAVKAGDIVEVQLYIESDAGIKGADWKITYNKDIFEYVADPDANGEIADYDYQQGTDVYDKDTAVRTYKFKALSLADEKTGKFDVVGRLNSSADEAFDGNIVPSDIVPAYVKVALDTGYSVVVKIDDKVVKKDAEGNYAEEFEYDGSNHIVKIIPVFETPDLVAEKVTYKINGEEVTTLEGEEFIEEGDYIIEYDVDGPAGYGNINGKVTLKITKPDFVVEVNLNKETIADYVKGDPNDGTNAKKLVLVYTNVDNVSFTYDENPMLDVTARGYKYVNHGANNGSGTIPVEYKHVFAYVTDFIEGGNIKSYEDLVKHASGKNYVKPEVVTYDDCDVNYAVDENGKDIGGQDIIVGYAIYNNLKEAFSSHNRMKMVLKSDLNGDKYVNVKDTSAIINAAYPQN